MRGIMEHIKVQWEDALGEVKTRVALSVDDLGKGHFIVHWVGGGTTHFNPQDNLTMTPMIERISVPGVFGELVRSDAPSVGEIYEKVLLTGTGKYGDGLFWNDARFVVIAKGAVEGEIVSCEVVSIVKDAALAKVKRKWCPKCKKELRLYANPEECCCPDCGWRKFPLKDKNIGGK
jgi:predicted RNA-binding protein with TRAM domain